MFEKGKEHFKKHKELYTGIVIGGVTVWFLKDAINASRLSVQVNPTIAPVMNNVVHNTVNNGGHCAKIPQCVETGELWPTMTDLAKKIAEEHDIAYSSARSMLSRHVNGYEGFEHLFGKHYEIAGLRTTG